MTSGCRLRLSGTSIRLHRPIAAHLERAHFWCRLADGHSVVDTRFVVQSPFHAMMAAELRRQFEIDDDACEMVVLQPAEPEALRQLRQVIADDTWTNQRWSPLRTRSQRAQVRFVKSIEDDPVDRLVVGDIRTVLLNHLANRHPAPWVLDDGLGVELVCAQRRSGSAPAWWPPRAGFAARCFGLDTNSPRQLAFFSMFDLELAPGDVWTRNELAGLRSAASAAALDKASHLLLGSPWPAVGMLDEATYVAATAEVFSRHVGTPTYLPHRREHPDTVRRVLERSSATLSPHAGPAERSIPHAASIPARISSFHSTASCTLFTAIGDRIELVNYDVAVDGAGRVPDGVKAVVDRHSKGRIASVTLDQRQLLST